MSMLDRYRKPGGFYQLLCLMETCAPAKKEKFLEIIRSESTTWAEAIKAKMLDISRIYSWKDETLAEIFGTLQDLTIAIALIAGDEKLKTRVYGYMTPSRKRKIEDLIGPKKPSPDEIATMHMKIIETVRKMAHDGYIRFDKVDPDLYFDEKIEESLNKAQTTAATTLTSSKSEFSIEYENSEGAPSADAQEASAPSGENSEARTAEIIALKKKMADMSKENAVLRHELSVAKNKLEQIKKIA